MLAYIITAVFILCYMGITLWQCRGVKLTIKAQALCGLSSALTIALTFVYIPLPTGSAFYIGAIIPLMLLAICYDYRLAFISGFVTSVLVIFVVPGWVPVHWAQFVVEYLPYFSCLGYAGIFGSDSKKKLLGGIGIAVLLRITCRVLSGILFFSQDAWEGFNSVTYSLLFNLSSCIPEAIVAAVVMLALPINSVKKALHTGGTV